VRAPQLEIPEGLIGTASEAHFAFGLGRPFFPFLSLAHLALAVFIYVVIAGAIILVAPKVWPFIAGGALIGIMPSMIAASPAKIVVRTPRPAPWVKFFEQWAHTWKYEKDFTDPHVWISQQPPWLRWPGERMSLLLTEAGFEVTGRRLLMRQLKRNFDRITTRGYPC
jgi:hypothetical protein